MFPVIALDLLVDNSFVIIDGVLDQLPQAIKPAQTARDGVAQSAMPRLGARLAAILASAAIGTSLDASGEIRRPPFQVGVVSLRLNCMTAAARNTAGGRHVSDSPGKGRGRHV